VTVYQFYDPQPVLFNLAGIGPIPNGKVYFYEIGTTDPKDTWSDYAKGDPALNSNPVLLDSAGRPNTEIWLDGEYTVKVEDEDAVTINTFDMRPAADSAASIPIPEDDEYLGGDGTSYIAKTYRGLPDPTGMVGYYPVADGEGYVLTPVPEEQEIPDPEIVITATPNKSVRIGVSDDTTKFLTQYGSDTVSPSGTKTVTDSVVFPTAFSATPWWVDVVPTSGPAATDGAYVTWHITSISTTGFTVTFNIPDDDTRSQWQIANTINYIWKAEGTVVVA
jgi:hypothetical protein